MDRPKTFALWLQSTEDMKSIWRLVCLSFLVFVSSRLEVAGHDEGEDLLPRVESMIIKSIDYLQSVRDHLTLDALLGSAVLAHQSEVLLRYIECSNRSQSIATSLRNINQHAARLIRTSLSDAFLRSPLYFQSVGRLLSGRFWSSIQANTKTHIELSKTLETFKQSYSTRFSHFRLNESLADYCLGEVLNKCRIRPVCSALLIETNHTGYGQAHQALYLMIAKTMKCFDGMSAATVNDIDERISRLCTSMYMDNIDIEGGDYPNKDQDLFMENIFICGYNGFALFRNKTEWLREILRWQQQSNGCFQVDAHKVAQLFQSKQLRGKRRETIFADGCSLHKTSIALATASVYLQHMIVESIQC